jgi:hypothetical protein
MDILMRIIFIILLLSGCQYIPPNLVGNWSGKVGPFKASFELGEDGKGVFCYSGRKKNKTEWIKYSSGIITTERDTKMIVVSLRDNELIVDVNNFGNERYTFYRDNHLRKASWFCWRELSVK